MRTGITFQNFVDVGCGKGLPCIFAKKYFSFPQVYGIDFSAPLIEIARRNQANTRYPGMSFQVADATSWKLPQGDTLVLLNNPFNDIILEKFLTLNLEHFRENRSLIAYGNDSFRATICHLGFEVVYRSNRHHQSLFRYTGSSGAAA